MKKTILTTFLLGCCSSFVAHAAPVDCTSLSTLQQYISQSALGGCFVQDKLFTDFSYTGGGTQSASNVNVTATLSSIPGLDIHGFTFVPSNVWTSTFSVGYTISVMEPSTGATIVAALDQLNLGPVVNGTTAVSTKSNGPVFNLNQGNLTDSSAFSGVTSIASMTTVTIPTNAFLISLEEQYTQEVGQVPEPATYGLLATALVGLGLLRRKVRVNN